MSLDARTLGDLIDGRLPWPRLHQTMSAYKDPDRFRTYRQVLQARLGWDEPVVLALTDKLFIVDAGDRGLVRCRCGQWFGDWRENWKHAAHIAVRRSAEELEALFGPLACDPEWMEIRELVCPGCASVLEVETAVPGWPLLHDFEPDLAAFYRDWLDEPPPRWADDG